jgi:thiamine kinase-like enzyme
VSAVDPELHKALDKVPALGGPREITELPGGLTNRNYKVTTASGSYVARVSAPGAELLSIDRSHEHQNTLRAARAGVGAPVVDYLPADRVMVVGYIDGVTFTDESLKVPGNLERVAASCRRLHAGERFVSDFDMFDIQRGYLNLVLERGFRLPPGYADYLEPVAAIRSALAVRDEGTVPCNNDLLAANFIDDGRQVWLIDYEYAGNNDACFELGNIWSECHLTLDELEELVTCYYGRPLRNKFARAQLLGLMSKYGWTLWASIQDGSSSIDFDFWGWGLERYDAAVAMFTDHGRFGKLLDDAQRPD